MTTTTDYLSSGVTRPLLRYHGGKWKLARWIVSHFPKHRVYVEPFGGAASVLLRKPRSYAEVYNDLDSELVNLFRVARDAGEELCRRIYLTPFARDEFATSYVPSDDPIEQARRTLVRSFMGFGSNAHNKPTGFRANSNRSGTTPARDWLNFPESLRDVVDRLRGVVLENRPALDCIEQHDGLGTLFYLDPPYLAQARDSGTDYRHELSEDDHRALAARIKTLKGMVMVSGYPCALYDDLFADWHVERRHAHADGARVRTECLWISPQTPISLDLFTTFCPECGERLNVGASSGLCGLCLDDIRNGTT